MTHNVKPFIELYRKANLTLSKCALCRGMTNVEYYPGKAVRLSCFAGCNVLVRKWDNTKLLDAEKKPTPAFWKKEKEFVVKAVNDWNEMNQFDVSLAKGWKK